MHKHLLIFLVSLLAISCTNTEEKVKSLATNNLTLSVDIPEKLEILGVSQVDSAFGIGYLTATEMRHLFECSRKVSEKVVKQTKNFTNLERLDPAILSLIERQMKSTSEIRSLLMKPSKKGDFSGYKVRIVYRCEDPNGRPYKAERWYFTDPKCQQVIKTFEVPLL